MSSLTRRQILASLAVAPAAMRAIALGPSTSTLFIGTYTTAGSHGVYAAQWNAADGSLSDPALVATTPSPSFLALSPASTKRRILYAVNEIDNFAGTHNGSVTPFRLDTNNLHGVKLAADPAGDSGGKGPCHIALDSTGRSIFVANYDSGSVASFLATEKGISPAVSTFKFSGHGANSKRQEAPHMHAVTVSPGNRYLLANDLGLDRIMIYRLNPATAHLAPNTAQPYYAAKPGSGPRHSLFHPNGRWLYCVNELTSTVDHLAWNEQNGTLTFIATYGLLPPDFPVTDSLAAELAIDTAGKFLYASNRGHNSIVIFSVDDHSGALTFVDRTRCLGKEPRHFVIDPSGHWLLVANEKSNNIVLFRRDGNSGTLKEIGRSAKLIEPVCLVFL